MLSHSTLLAILSVLGAQRVLAQLKATAPGPNETFTAGSSCTIAWTPDASGSWTNVTIDLMSGSNNNMSTVKNVAIGLDGTDKSLTPYSWTCPEVDPYSAIYFYQFTNGDDTSTRTWTTRFTIASPSNDTVLPDHPQQPNGDNIPWGLGYIKDNKSASSSGKDNTGSSASVDATLSAPSASATATTGREKKSHNPKTSDSDSGDQSDSDTEDSDDGSMTGTGSTSKTRSANVAGAKSSAARATAMAHMHSSSPSTSDSDESDDSGSQSPSGSEDGDQAQATKNASNPSYKNSGAADAADSASAVGCQCGYASDSTSGANALSAANIISSVVASGLFVLLSTCL